MTCELLLLGYKSAVVTALFVPLKVVLMQYKELLRTDEKPSTLARSKDRRRAGRNAQGSPHLIPLLRNPTTVEAPAPLQVDADMPFPDDDLAPAKGVLFALALSLPLWAGIAGIVWAVSR